MAGSYSSRVTVVLSIGVVAAIGLCVYMQFSTARQLERIGAENAALEKKAALLTVELATARDEVQSTANQLREMSRRAETAEKERAALAAQLAKAPTAAVSSVMPAAEAPAKRDDAWSRMTSTPEGKAAMRKMNRVHAEERVAWFAKRYALSDAEREALIELNLDRTDRMGAFFRSRPTEKDLATRRQLAEEQRRLDAEDDRKMTELLGGDRFDVYKKVGDAAPLLHTIRQLSAQAALGGQPLTAAQIDAASEAAIGAIQAVPDPDNVPWAFLTQDDAEKDAASARADEVAERQTAAFMQSLQAVLSADQIALIQREMQQQREQRAAWVTMQKAADATKKAGQ